MNFKEYIDKDIEEKKVLLDLLPMNTEARVEKYKETIDEIINHYNAILSNVRDYMNYKYAKLYPKKNDRSKLINQKQQEIESYRNIILKTNPDTSFYEKSGIDMLIFDLEHYYNYSLIENNDIIIKLINCIKDYGISISENDFKINTFSYNYIYNIFQMILGVNVDLEIFKKIFWKCPEVYINIIICFRFLISKNAKKFNRSAANIDNNLLRNQGVNNRDELLNKYYSMMEEKKQLEEKDESDIILDFVEGNLDFGIYANTSDNKYGELDYFLINPIDTNNESLLNHTLHVVNNFYNNTLEYQKMSANTELFDYIINLYNKSIASVDKKQLMKEYTEKNKKINKLWSTAKKKPIIKKITIENIDNCFSEVELNKCIEQQKLLREIYAEYNNLDKQYFDIVLKNRLQDNSFISVIIEIIISYPFFSRSIIKTVFELESSDDVTNKYYQLFDLFYSPYRKLIDMKSVFSKENFEQRLMNSYRFDNLNVNNTSYEEDNLKLIIANYEKLINKIKISSFKHSIDEIEFLIEYSKLKEVDNN